MKLTRILLLGSLLAALAAPALAEEKPIVYTVKKGDTLWGISKRFIKDPDYWPNLWANNPGIGNPHLIYPGQTLHIYDGRIEIVPVAPPAQESVAEGTGQEPAPADTAQAQPREIDTHGSPYSFVSSEEVATLGTIIDTTENRFMMYEGDTIYLEMHNLAETTPGQQLQILEKVQEITHPVTGKLVGYQISERGIAEVTGKTDDVAVAVIKKSRREVQRGAWVRPTVEAPQSVPVKPASVALQGVIITSDSRNESLSAQDVIHVDFGRAAGLEPGNELKLYRTRVFTKSARPIKQLDPDNFVELPDIDLGKAVVIAVQENSAAALVTSVGNLPLYRGDLVKTVQP